MRKKIPRVDQKLAFFYVNLVLFTQKNKLNKILGVRVPICKWIKRRNVLKKCQKIFTFLLYDFWSETDGYFLRKKVDGNLVVIPYKEYYNNAQKPYWKTEIAWKIFYLKILLFEWVFIASGSVSNNFIC